MKTWGLYHSSCVDCGSTSKKHVSHGLCTTCYKRRLRAGTRPPAQDRPWSSIAPACVECGRTDRRHRARGLCRACYQRKYVATENGQRVSREAQQRYFTSEHGKRVRRAVNRRWLTNPENREKDRLASRRAREARWGVQTEVPMGYERLVLDVFGSRCAACESSDNLELDHHRPLHLGNALLHNAVPLCRSCNAKKHRKLPREFYDGWTLATILLRLIEVREQFARRFPEEPRPC